MSRVLRLLIGRATWRRWAYLVVGGALLMPYWFLSMIVVASLGAGQPASLVLSVVLPLPASFVTGLVPAVRVLEGTAVKELVGGPIAAQRVTAAREWPARVRTGIWFTLHLHGGVVVCALSLAIPALVLALVVVPISGWMEHSPLAPIGGTGYAWIAPLGGLLLLTALIAVFAALGGLLARLAPRFLGPSSVERLAEVESRAVRLAERNRLARELHDSVGHALSIVTLQAAAGRRVLAGDPEFAREALRAIEESARAALEDLDHVLGLLRDDGMSTAPQLTLGDLDGLLDKDPHGRDHPRRADRPGARPSAGRGVP